MKTVDIKVLDLTASYEIPETVAEYDALAKSEGAALRAAIQQELNHGSYGAIRATMCDLLEGKAITTGTNPDGTEIKTQYEAVSTRRLLFKNEPVTAEEVEKDGKKITVYTNSKGKKLTEDQAAEVRKETEKNFFDRVCAELGVEKTHFQALFEVAVKANPFDPSAAERKSAEARVNKTWLKVAEKIVADGNWENAARGLGELIGKPVDVSNPETRVLNLANAIQENERREAKARVDKYAALG